MQHSTVTDLLSPLFSASNSFNTCGHLSLPDLTVTIMNFKVLSSKRSLAKETDVNLKKMSMYPAMVPSTKCPLQRCTRSNPGHFQEYLKKRPRDR